MGNAGKWIGRYLAGVVVFWWLYQGGVSVAIADYKPRVAIRVNVMLYKGGKLPEGRTPPTIKWLVDWTNKLRKKGVDPCTRIKAFGIRFVCIEPHYPWKLPVDWDDHPYLHGLFEEVQSLGVPIKCSFGVGVLEGNEEQWGRGEVEIGSTWNHLFADETGEVKETKDAVRKWYGEVSKGSLGGDGRLSSGGISSGIDVIFPCLSGVRRQADVKTEDVRMLEGVGTKDASILMNNDIVRCVMLVGAAQAYLAGGRNMWNALMDSTPKRDMPILPGPKEGFSGEKMAPVKKRSSFTYWPQDYPYLEMMGNGAGLFTIVGDINFIVGPKIFRGTFEPVEKFRNRVNLGRDALSDLFLPLYPYPYTQDDMPSWRSFTSSFSDMEAPSYTLCLLFRGPNRIISYPYFGGYFQRFAYSLVSRDTLDKVRKFAEKKAYDVMFDFSDTESLEEYHGDGFSGNMVKIFFEEPEDKSEDDKPDDEPSKDKSEGGKSDDKSKGDKPSGDKPKDDTPSGGKSEGGKSKDDKPSGGKPEGGKSKDDKPSGGKSEGGTPSEDTSEEELEEEEEDPMSERSQRERSGSNCEDVPKFRENQIHLLTR